MLISNETLCLRRLAPADAQDFLAYRNDPEVARYQSWPDMTAEETDGFLWHSSNVSPLLRTGEWAQIAIANVQGDQLMGDIGIHLSENGSEAELGITLARAYQGRGLGTQAMRLAIDLAFEVPTVTQIICGADSRNTASLRLIRRLGCTYTHDEVMPGKDGAPDTLDHLYVLPRPTAI